MSLALIQEAAKEVRRLAIAGSPLAVGDFRLKKLLAPLEQAGAKVPVFAQVAKAINDVVNGGEADSAANLLNLSTLLNAILYTQGQSGAEGEMRELETFASNSASTRTPARLLKPLVQALTSTGSGRFEIVKSAVERGAFNDLRLIDPAIQALGDVYPEVADLVAEKILPGYGPGIAPLLKSSLDLKGKKSDARRLQILHDLDPAGTLPLCKTALDDGSPEVKVAAIACLGKHEDCLPLVLEQANAKNKQLRAAALEALAAHDRPEITSLFVKLAQGKDLIEMSGVIRRTNSQLLIEVVLTEGSKAAQKAIRNDSAGVDRLAEVLSCIEYRKGREIEEWLLARFEEVTRSANTMASSSALVASGIARQMAEMLYRIGEPRALSAILALKDVLPPDCFQLIVQTAVRSWPSSQVFDQFGPLLKSKKKPDKQKAGALENVMGISLDRQQWATVTEDYSRSLGLRSLQAAEWDSRWLDEAIKADRHLMVCYLARPNHKVAIKYLVESLVSGKPIEAPYAVRALAQCRYPKLTDVFLDLVSKAIKGARQLNWATTKLFESARHLPQTDLPKLDEFAAKLDEKFMDSFLEAIAPLRSTQQTN